MAEEYFDVVDDQDQVIDRLPRAEVHARGLKHRATHIFLFNENGQLFLQKRSMSKDCFPGLWDSSAAGHVDPGESYDACAGRELQEELGASPSTALERLFKVDACEATGWEFVWLYRGISGGPFVLQESEVETGAWFDLPILEGWMRRNPEAFAPSFPLLWARYRSAIG